MKYVCGHAARDTTKGFVMARMLSKRPEVPGTKYNKHPIEISILVASENIPIQDLLQHFESSSSSCFIMVKLFCEHIARFNTCVFSAWAGEYWNVLSTTHGWSCDARRTTPQFHFSAAAVHQYLQTESQTLPAGNPASSCFFRFLYRLVVVFFSLVLPEKTFIRSPMATFR